MNPALVLVALVVAGGAVACIAASETRYALAGLAVTLLAAPFLADPLPAPLALGARLVAAALATYLPWIVVRDAARTTRGSLLGWPVDALIAAAAFVIGFGTAGLGAAALGPAEAQGAGYALVALSVGPIVFGRDLFRLGAGGLLLIVGVALVGVGLGGTSPPFAELVFGTLVVAYCGGLTFLLWSAAAAGVAATEVLDDVRPPRAASASR